MIISNDQHSHTTRITKVQNRKVVYVFPRFFPVGRTVFVSFLLLFAKKDLQYGVLSVKRSILPSTESTLVIRASNSQQTFALTVSRQMLIKPNPPEECCLFPQHTNILSPSSDIHS
jgi:hypothetical protein